MAVIWSQDALNSALADENIDEALSKLASYFSFNTNNFSMRHGLLDRAALSESTAAPMSYCDEAVRKYIVLARLVQEKFELNDKEVVPYTNALIGKFGSLYVERTITGDDVERVREKARKADPKLTKRVAAQRITLEKLQTQRLNTYSFCWDAVRQSVPFYTSKGLMDFPYPWSDENVKISHAARYKPMTETNGYAGAVSSGRSGRERLRGASVGAPDNDQGQGGSSRRR